jgi:hypothetical protein
MRVIIVLLGLISVNLYSQSISKMKISYGETIFLGEVHSTVSFSVFDGSSTFVLKGSEINQHIFSKPGNYSITIDNKEPFTKGECNHASLPQQINVSVEGNKINFDGENIRFSVPIQKNKDTKGIVMSIPIRVESYDSKPVQLMDVPVNSAGIGSTITAKLVNSAAELSVGQHVINYELSGKVTQNAYLMFDFVDANGSIQTVSLHQPIQN